VPRFLADESCDFAVVRARPLEASLEERYVDALLQELAQRRCDFAERHLTSLYFGGGTPSLLTPRSVERLVEAMHAAFPTQGSVEITLEVNPSSLERERLSGFRAAGVNRLSIGIQAFDEEVLRRLGRAHRSLEGHTTLAAARHAGFENISLDLIFAAPHQTAASFAQDLGRALSFAPEHLSAYELSIEEGTPFATAAARGQLARPSEDETLVMLECLVQASEAAGLERYEISSFARQGFESRHNRRYWRREPVLGLGAAAWSCEPRSLRAPHGARRNNVRALGEYLARVRVGQDPERVPAEVLSPETARAEAMFLGLRTREGVAALRFASEFGAPPRGFFETEISDLIDAGLLLESPSGDLQLSGHGRVVADSIAERFMVSGPSEGAFQSPAR